MDEQNVVLIQERPLKQGKKMGVATLNAEKRLNALSLTMIEKLLPQLQAWEQDNSVVCVWLQGTGERAFCAGGDVVSLCKQDDDKINDYAETFFSREYRLDHLIHTYRKPLIVWGHGIVMGGGIGLMSGAGVRVVTETARLAMPEINIGLFPDVGSTYFLTRTPGKTGLYLGLTGALMNAADALFVGLADRFIKHEYKQPIIESLSNAHWPDEPTQWQSVVNQLMREYEAKSRTALPDEAKVTIHFDLINSVCDGDSCAEIVANILAIKSDDKWIQKAKTTLEQGCPTTAHLVYEQLRRGRHLSLREIFQMELIIATHCAKERDFREGVRALLIDKDHNPQWQHPNAAEVPHEHIEKHFSALWERNPLADLR